MLTLRAALALPRQTGSGKLAGLAMRAMLPMLALLLLAVPVMAQAEHQGGGEANLVLPDLDMAQFLGGIGGRTLLMAGLVVSFLGFVFGLIIYKRLQNMPVHSSMREVSELIYETCKTYLVTEGKFLLLLECFIGVIIVFYFGLLQGFPALKVLIILFFSLLDEQQRRLYAGLEAHKFGHGGDRRIAEFFGLDAHTVARGRQELFEEQVWGAPP